MPFLFTLKALLWVRANRCISFKFSQIYKGPNVQNPPASAIKLWCRSSRLPGPPRKDLWVLSLALHHCSWLRCPAVHNPLESEGETHLPHWYPGTFLHSAGGWLHSPSHLSSSHMHLLSRALWQRQTWDPWHISQVLLISKPVRRNLKKNISVWIFLGLCFVFCSDDTINLKMCLWDQSPGHAKFPVTIPPNSLKLTASTRLVALPLFWWYWLWYSGGTCRCTGEYVLWENSGSSVYQELLRTDTWLPTTLSLCGCSTRMRGV